MLGFKPTIPLVALGNTLSLPGFWLIPAIPPMSLVPPGNTLSHEFQERNLSPPRHHTQRILLVISTPVMSTLTHQMKALPLTRTTIVPPLLVLAPAHRSYWKFTAMPL